MGHFVLSHDQDFTDLDFRFNHMWKSNIKIALRGKIFQICSHYLTFFSESNLFLSGYIIAWWFYWLFLFFFFLSWFFGLFEGLSEVEYWLENAKNVCFSHIVTAYFHYQRNISAPGQNRIRENGWRRPKSPKQTKHTLCALGEKMRRIRNLSWFLFCFIDCHGDRRRIELRETRTYCNTENLWNQHEHLFLTWTLCPYYVKVTTCLKRSLSILSVLWGP